MASNDERWTRIEAVFAAAADFPVAERRAYVAQACADDPELRVAIERLLDADEAAGGGPLDAPLAFLGAALFELEPESDEAPASLSEGTRVGPYRILEPIAHGGMGSVYRAERADGAFVQQVAIKVVRGSWVADQLERRFLRERQILARLQHPGIARLLDGGLTAEGSPYLAMELVAGERLDRWADSHGLDVTSRLRVFLEVCDAVQYAHRNLIVHRDLKPSNILVTREGRVRLLDFGIAGLLSEDTNGDPVTRTGMMLLTPEYAAPEQIRGEPATTATDVYALGVILYELLAGRRPFDFSSRSWAEVARTLDQDPPPLSRAAGLDRKLRRQLDGDLETIVGRALHKEVERRYPSVEALAEDIRRFLDRRPVTARPDTFGYRAQKYVRRNRLAVGAASAVAAAVLIGLFTTLWQARAARQEAARAQAVSTFLFELFAGADPDQNLGEIPDARELLDIGAARVDSLGPEAGPELRVEMLTTLGLLYRKLGLGEQARSLLERAVAVARGSRVSGAATGAALDILAATLIELGDFDSARVVAEEGLRTRRAAGVPDTLLAESLSTLGVEASLSGRFDDAVTYHREALALDRQALPSDHARIATDLSNLGLVLGEMNRLAESEAVLRESLEMRRRVFGEIHPDVATSYGGVAGVVGSAGDLRAAEEMHRRGLEINRQVFGDDHPEVARSLDQVALWLDRQGRYPEADSLYRLALDSRISAFGDRHPDVGATMNNIATLRYRNRDFGAAAQMQARALEIWVEAYGAEHPRTATAINNLGVMQVQAGDLGNAERNLNRALEIRRRLFPDGHEDVGASLRNLGDLRRAQGRLGEALSLYEQARSEFAAALGADHWRSADALFGIGAANVDRGRPTEAVAPLEEALRIRSGVFAEGDLRTEEARLWLGLAESALGQTTRARSLLEEAHRVFLETRGPEDVDTRRAAAALAGLR